MPSVPDGDCQSETRAGIGESIEVERVNMMGDCQDWFSLTILLEGSGVQGTNEEVSPDTSRC